MSDKTVVITGATGLLGRQVVRAFQDAEWNVVGTGFSRAKPPTIRKVDLGNDTEVLSLLEETKPRVVIHCAAERFPDKCASDPSGTQRLNVAATQLLAEACSARGIVLIYISTDYVFPGVPGEAPYSHDSPTNPPNFYGETKLAGEQAVLSCGGVVLRVPVLYGEVERNGESSVNTLLDVVWNREGKTGMEMDAWSIRYPTNTEDVARVLKDIAEKYKNGTEGLPKVLQFSSEDRMTKYEICQIMADVAGLPLDHLAPNATNDPNSTVQRPYDCHLSTQALKDIGIDVSTVNFKDWWQRYLRAYKK
ncbi:NAD(P)-binding protein [Wilcoxina mikolae CBS 423.85]|nr:NAD(P)-binding protein [Wilcoxina mikolae CBS 423.85]